MRVMVQVDSGPGAAGDAARGHREAGPGAGTRADRGRACRAASRYAVEEAPEEVGAEEPRRQRKPVQAAAGRGTPRPRSAEEGEEGQCPAAAQAPAPAASARARAVPSPETARRRELLDQPSDRGGRGARGFDELGAARARCRAAVDAADVEPAVSRECMRSVDGRTRGCGRVRARSAGGACPRPPAAVAEPEIVAPAEAVAENAVARAEAGGRGAAPAAGQAGASAGVRASRSRPLPSREGGARRGRGTGGTASAESAEAAPPPAPDRAESGARGLAVARTELPSMPEPAAADAGDRQYAARRTRRTVRSARAGGAAGSAERRPAPRGLRPRRRPAPASRLPASAARLGVEPRRQPVGRGGHVRLGPGEGQADEAPAARRVEVDARRQRHACVLAAAGDTARRSRGEMRRCRHRGRTRRRRVPSASGRASGRRCQQKSRGCGGSARPAARSSGRSAMAPRAACCAIGRRRDEQVLGQACHRLDQRFGQHQPAEPPAGHAVDISRSC